MAIDYNFLVFFAAFSFKYEFCVFSFSFSPRPAPKGPLPWFVAHFDLFFRLNFDCRLKHSNRLLKMSVPV